MGKERDQRQYLKDYPQLHKWVNECIICGTKGYNPQIDMKEEKIAVNNLKSVLPPLEVNELKMCSTCARLLKEKSNRTFCE